MIFFWLIVSNIIYYYTCTRIVVVICKIFKKYKVIDKLYIFCKIYIIYYYNKNLINCYLFIVVLITIAIIFAIFILLIVSILL